MIKQFIPEEICLNCQGCCRFTQKDSSWAPALLVGEIKGCEGKKIRLVPGKKNFFCSFFSPEENKCQIYAFRPFECQLYPFLIRRQGNKATLALDLHCPFIERKLNTPEFKAYSEYLKKLLDSPKYLKMLKDNPQVIQEYPEALDMAVLNLL